MNTGLRSVIGEGSEGDDPREEKARYWRRQLAACRGSGESQAEYCRRHDLSPHRFTYWKRRITEDGNESLALVEVPQAVVSNTELKVYGVSSAVVKEAGRYRVELHPDFCRQTLCAVLDELERRR